MNKKFFSGNKISNIKNENFFIRSILILFFAVLTPIFLHAKEQDSVVIKKSQEAVIYVTPGTSIEGIYISNAKVIKIENTAVPKKKVKSQAKYNTLAEQVTEKKIVQQQSLKKLQEKIDKEKKNIFYSSSPKSELVRLTKVKLLSAFTAGYSDTFKFAKALISKEILLPILYANNVQHKFYTSTSLLKVGKHSHSFLRGPPQLS